MRDHTTWHATLASASRAARSAVRFGSTAEEVPGMQLDVKQVTALTDGERVALKALTEAVYPPRSPARRSALRADGTIDLQGPPW
jgi:hypothetical protein